MTLRVGWRFRLADDTEVLELGPKHMICQLFLHLEPWVGYQSTEEQRFFSHARFLTSAAYAPGVLH